jgi:hypothetical protein
MVEAFSTACSSAKASSSVGDLDLRSWSFISRIRGVLGGPASLLKKRCAGRGEGGNPQVSARRVLGPDAASGSVNQKPECICLRFRRVF